MVLLPVPEVVGGWWLVDSGWWVVGSGWCLVVLGVPDCA